MPNEILPFDKTKEPGMSRRMFGSLSLGGAAAVTTSAIAAELAVIESDVLVKMADGNCDAALFHPTGTGPWPGAVIFADALGLRPAFREMGRRLAGQGFTVLVPNPFFRVRQAPVLSGPFDFAKPEDRAKLTELRVGLTTEARSRDGTTYIAFLDTLPQVNTKVKIGVSGYCMGGPYTMLTAAAAPDRVGAAASFHGGGLVTDQPDSPHLLASKIKAQYYFAVAADDDQRAPEAKVKLRDAFAGKPATVVVYDGCQHGWCVNDGMVYNRDGSERAFAELVALYKRALV
ncbi:MAG: dienelactone hydrolase family protein [Acetobacteraceae bacterium]|nr:dienelactone hydrolase family protein [Acetobacteraceae bacterium]